MAVVANLHLDLNLLVTKKEHCQFWDMRVTCVYNACATGLYLKVVRTVQ
jgi:hypothetical protein